MANATLEERAAVYSVPRRSDDNYANTTFICPTNGRSYLSVRPVVVDTAAVATYCFWCDTAGRVRRKDAAFDASEPQPHSYPFEAEL